MEGNAHDGLASTSAGTLPVNYIKKDGVARVIRRAYGGGGTKTLSCWRRVRIAMDGDTGCGRSGIKRIITVGCRPRVCTSTARRRGCGSSGGITASCEVKECIAMV